jgi:hypothetical protein
MFQNCTPGTAPITRSAAAGIPASSLRGLGNAVPAPWEGVPYLEAGWGNFNETEWKITIRSSSIWPIFNDLRREKNIIYKIAPGPLEEEGYSACSRGGIGGTAFVEIIFRVLGIIFRDLEYFRGSRPGRLPIQRPRPLRKSIWWWPQLELEPRLVQRREVTARGVAVRLGGDSSGEGG